MPKILLAGCVALALLGCGRSTDSDEGADHYDTRGVVRGFSPDRSTIEIQHENIPGFMPSMTMPFVARNPKEVAGLKIGDAIAFRMAVTPKDFWIENVKKIRREAVNIAEPKQTSSVSAERNTRLKEGDGMPPFSLTNQKCERISLHTFRGQPFVLTFVFTRCPVPNFCPRMEPTREKIGGLQNPHEWILQRKVEYAAFVPTIDGHKSKAEIRMMFVWPDQDRDPTLVNNLVRMSQGKMMGVDFNVDKTWVGASIALHE